MSLLALLFSAAAVTIGSRIVALAVLPPPRGRLAEVVGRLPAPLFAGLAALSLVGSDAGAGDPPTLAALGCALLASRWSSLLLTLVAGLGGFVLVGLLW